MGMRILSIDPGSNNTGVCVLDYDDNGKVSLLYSTTIHGDRLAKQNSHMVINNTTRFSRIYSTGQRVLQVMQSYGITVVACEAPYMGRFPASFSTLSQLVYEFNRRTYEYSMNTEFFLIDPSSVKKGMGVKGTSSDKEAMRTALAELQLPMLEGLDIETMDEHAVDACCVGLYYCKLLDDLCG